MELPPYPPPPFPVVSPRYCAPYPIDLSIIRKMMTTTHGSFNVTDPYGNNLFKVRGSFLSLRNRRVLLDASGSPLLTLQRKILSTHQRWKAYRGESSDPRDLLFSVKRSSMVQLMRTKLHVFLANNTGEDHCDFRVEGSWFSRNCVIYAGDSNFIVAKMREKQSIQSVLLGKDSFMVTVYPGIDAALVTAIIVILDSMDNEDGTSASD